MDTKYEFNHGDFFNSNGDTRSNSELLKTGVGENVQWRTEG